MSGIEMPECHPLFEIVAGSVEPWERIQERNLFLEHLPEDRD
jgi:hypothetical protein